MEDNKPMKNLRSLRDDLLRIGRTTDIFTFVYRRVEYIVVVHVLTSDEKTENNLALLNLHFMKSSDLNHELWSYANSLRLLIDEIDIYEYFNIVGDSGYGLRNLYDAIGNKIPANHRETYSKSELFAAMHSLNRHDSEDPDRIYCFAMKRLPKGQFRSEYNTYKTLWLRPKLIEDFVNDYSVCFLYSTEKADERDDSDILKRFSDNEEQN